MSARDALNEYLDRSDDRRRDASFLLGYLASAVDAETLARAIRAAERTRESIDSRLCEAAGVTA